MASENAGRLVPHTAKAPVNLSLNKEPSGCTILEVAFGSAYNTEIEEIRFKNHYTAFLSIKWCAKLKSFDADLSAKPAPWAFCVRNLQLMPDPRSEDGGQGHFTIARHMFESPLVNVGTLTLRFILQQPCATWREFGIENLEFHKRVESETSNGARADSESSVAATLKRLSSGAGGGGDVARMADDVTSPLSQSALDQLCTLTQSAALLLNGYHEMLLPTRKSQIGRFDRDGVYDIHALSNNP